MNLNALVSVRLHTLLLTHTDKELAAKLGVSKRTIQNWRRDCSGMTIKKIETLDTYFSKVDKEGKLFCAVGED